jgi:putative metalloprotease
LPAPRGTAGCRYQQGFIKGKYMFRHIALATLAVGSLTACQNMDMAGMVGAASSLFQAATVSDEQIQELAVSSQQQLDSQNKIASANSNYATRLAKVTRNLSSYQGTPLQFKAYLNPEVNAFALPNGSIRVYSGLMDKMTDNELLFVLGHEVGHVIEGHSKAQARSSMLTLAAQQAGAASGVPILSTLSGSQLGALANGLVNAQYSQSHEYAADAFGLKVLKEQGHDKSAAVSALRKLESLSQGSSSVFSSHPDSGNRADRIEAM